jgi:hypothetical protein
MINKEFIAETDKLIGKIAERGVKLENGNMLVAKVKSDRQTKGGLFLSEDHAEIQDYHSGFARILALPPLREEDAQLKVGDYIMHSHEARYLPYGPAIREVLDYFVEDKFIYAVQDAEVILHIPKEKFN